MGLSRNKVAVSEGAAGSPPFYGEPDRHEDAGQKDTKVSGHIRRTQTKRKNERKGSKTKTLLFDFEGPLSDAK